MNAFDTAWEFTKAPLDVESIDFRNIGSNKPVAYFDDDNIDSDTYRERLPMFMDMGERFPVSMRIDDGSEKGYANIEIRDDMNAHLHPQVRRDYQGRGYATGMYDLLAYYLQQAGMNKLLPYPVQSPAAKQLWESRQPEVRLLQPYSNQIPDGEGISTDWPSSIHWRPTV